MSSKLITMIVMSGSLVVARPRDKDGELRQMSPPKGKPFDFTEDELADIQRLSPGAVRKPVNESEVTSLANDTSREDQEDEDRKALASVAKPADEPEPAVADKPTKGKGKATDDGLGGL